jgi:polyketide synthase 12
LDELPDLTAVVHAAGVLDDGTIDSLDPERLRRVMAPKVDGALHLHELTRDRELAQFVLFSSIAATLGSPGQGNYSAANAFLNALAQQRRAEGLPATALAWGPWEQGMAGDLDDADRARSERLGVLALPDEQGLALYDTATAAAQPLLAPVLLDLGKLRTLAGADLLPAILRGLVRAPARRAQQGSLARLLAGSPEGEWQAVALDLVRGHIAAVLGHGSAQAIDPERNVKDLGFDSLSAVELRNRLIQATGLKLTPTLIFDHPTPAAIARQLVAMAVPAAAAGGASSEEQEMRRLLATIPISRLREAGLLDALVDLARPAGDDDGDDAAGANGHAEASIDEMDADELIRMTLGDAEPSAT